MPKRFLPLLLAVLLCSPAAAAEPILLGMSGAFTGPSRGLGIELYRGSMAYFNQLEASSGGLLGRPVRIKTLDDGYDPVPAMENTIDFIEGGEALALFNYVGTPTTTRVLPLLKHYSDRGILLFFPFSGAQPQREPPYAEYVFNLRDSYRRETSRLVDKFVELGRERIAVFYQADAYGRSGWDGVRRALDDHGLSMAAEATYRRGHPFQRSTADQVELIKAGNPEAIISVGSYEACAAFIRDARDAGLDAPIANLSFVGSENLLALLRSLGEDRYTRRLINTQVVPSYEDESLSAVREYRRAMDEFAPAPPEGAAKGYAPLRYSFVSFEGYLNAKTFAALVRRNGRVPDRKDMRCAAEGLRQFDLGVGAPVSFGPDDHQGLKRIYFTTVKDGVFVPVRDWTGWTQ
ncbi:ABC transporter substrate-binding protein [Desulfohalovibrio reitneri]|uniref:ABC transporter substrate-binding protein n=1 Tax=Desulfohalovibrio reitneri TaxID=1307759 RepID=UPI0004A75FF4|nr:ABC transporter substrate-binding protein [Desulfohalovibrio reitneri]